MIPFTRQIFGRFFYDYGYPFAKTLSIIAISFCMFLLGITHILPFSFISLCIIVALIAAGNIFLFRTQLKQIKKEKKPYFDNRQFFLILFEEVLFFCALAFLAFIRSREPSIRGLEKFMDFGFISSILRSDYFPPLDMWLSADQIRPEGYSINYYYFGHLVGAVLIKLSSISSFIGYNLILATVFAQGMTLAFSLCLNIVHTWKTWIMQTGHKIRMGVLIAYGFLGSFLVNLAGNLHTIYVFTTGYPNDDPKPFWTIFKSLSEIVEELSHQEDVVSTYWYPNATRFIPYTIHEFPSYSYVVADLHGHVFGIPFVLTILSIFFLVYLYYTTQKNENKKQDNKKPPRIQSLFKEGAGFQDIRRFFRARLEYENMPITFYSVGITLLLGFCIGIAYTTNALDGPIYLLFMLIIFFYIFQFSLTCIVHVLMVLGMFSLTVFPFSLFFSPFASGIGLNCSPEFLTNIKSIGPFIFEEGNCQVSPFWMLFILWGFFWVSFFILIIALFISHTEKMKNQQKKKKPAQKKLALVSFLRSVEGNALDIFALLIFAYGTFLILIPEIFYIKDIYPAHFRANTMFKLGYQAFIMMAIASMYTFFRLRYLLTRWRFFLEGIFLFFFLFVFIYPFYSFTSYYPGLDTLETYLMPSHNLDGSSWMKKELPYDKEMITYFQNHIKGQPVILEAQGDSYTDFNRVSAYTGLPTVAGWWVHEWLWRGSADIVGGRVPDIKTIYESDDMAQTRALLEKYHVSYVIISKQEREKYPEINEEKFEELGQKVFTSSDDVASIYKIMQENTK